MDLKNDFYEKISEHRTELQQLNKELNALPSGYLYRYSLNGNFRYKHAFISAKKRRRIEITKNEEMIKKLCRKRYLQNRIIRVKNNLKILERDYDKIMDTSYEEIIGSLSKSYKDLPFSYFYDKEKTHPWVLEKYNQLSNFSEQKTFPTVTGELVRSKSEQMIYDLLIQYKVPFHYEEVLILNGKWFFPDFTIKLSNGSKIYWEHAGMCSDNSYRRRHLDKMNSYYENDITEDKNLIVTYDRGKKGLSRDVVEGYIKGYILPFIDKYY